MKLRARRGMIPVNLWNPFLVGSRAVPAGLSETVTATLWQKHGDHPAVRKVDLIPLADANEIVEMKDGMVELYKGQPPVSAETLKILGEPHRDGTKFQQIRYVDAIIRREDADGHYHDYLVMPGFYIIENDSDGVVWALSPHHVRAWFIAEESA